MKKIHFAVASLALMTASGSFANEAYPTEGTAFRSQVTSPSTVSRAQVQAEARLASQNGEIRNDEAYPRFSAPSASSVSRANVQREAMMASESERFNHMSSDSNYIGGM
ncbi:MAG: DUF4148 domain-containing protein [Ideonella sp.]